MKKILTLIILIFIFLGFKPNEELSWIRINQLGYLPHTIKVAVLGSKEIIKIKTFSIHDSKTNEVVYTSDIIVSKGQFGPFKSTFRLNFSDFKTEGQYYIQSGNIRSPIFSINADVYDGTADFLLKYMRQQRCGYNPYLTDSCHLNDGFIVYNQNKNGQRIDVTGGWHDATDYLQYTATSANAIFQLLFAYRENPDAFGDICQANGLPGPNGIPDVIDEAKFGMDWLLKMNPSSDEYYNQIADDRDHAGFRLPNEDQVVYSEDHIGRPVYLASAEKQGLLKYKNRSTGAASTSGKYASTFAIGADILKKFYPEMTTDLTKRAIDAYDYAKRHPGVSQTAPCKSPYFYEEDNWLDDMELAAAELYRLTKKENFKKDALSYATMEKISPWIGKDSVNHYQYYPFFNAGHNELVLSLEGVEKRDITNYYKNGLQLLYDRGIENPFLVGIPFIWCSNNYITAAVTQCKLYKELTNDRKYDEMEAALRDWLFGCNPWGTSMIVGLPKDGDSPVYPHSSLNHLKGYQTDGGLIDGPVYGSIFNNLIGLVLEREDTYAELQSDFFVYHDDVGDYSTNEPTMDGTASLVYYLSSMEMESIEKGHNKVSFIYDNTGAIIRGNIKEKKLHLIFTGDRFADGAETILQVLKKHKIKASFFLTGNFYRDPEFKNFIIAAKKDGHYLGAHSNAHLLYNDWSEQKKLLVNYQEFSEDLEQNYIAMSPFGISKKDSLYFLPPYEWNDAIITQWSARNKLALINYSPGTLSHADYTLPLDKNYRSSEEIYNSIMAYEAKSGLNGFLLLSHLGTDPKRVDKFYHKLDGLITNLKEKKYSFTGLDLLLNDKK